MAIITASDDSDYAHAAAAARMSSAEFRAIRESLGLSSVFLTRRFGVAPQTVVRWEAGSRNEGATVKSVRVPTNIAAAMRKLQADSRAYVEAMIERHRRSTGLAQIITYRTDEEYDEAAAHGHVPPGMCASWHRIMCTRIAEALPGHAITYDATDTNDLFSWTAAANRTA